MREREEMKTHSQTEAVQCTTEKTDRGREGGGGDSSVEGRAEKEHKQKSNEG
jgi:hypothetical protein